MTNTEQLLFAGSYAPATEPSIHCMAFDSETGELTPKTAFTGIESPSFLTIHPNGRWLYAVSEMGMASHEQHGDVWAFSIDEGGEIARLRPINQKSSKGDWPCHVAIDHSGHWLMASNYGSGNAILYPILADGSLGDETALVQHEGSGPNAARQEGPHAHSAVFTPDNRFVIVADLGIDQLMMYSFDADSGALALHAAINTHAGAGPRHFAFHPNDTTLFVANELDSTVTAFRYDADKGSLDTLQTLSTLGDDGDWEGDGMGDSAESTVADIHLSAAGDRLYISNRGQNSIAVYDVTENGQLTTLALLPCGGNWPRNFALSPDNQWLLVANRRTNDISSMQLGSADAEIGTTVQQTTLTQPSCIEFR